MGVIGYRMKDGKKVYCLYDSTVKSDVLCAHPAKFSSEDSFSKYRVEFKAEHNLIPK